MALTIALSTVFSELKIRSMRRLGGGRHRTPLPLNGFGGRRRLKPTCKYNRGRVERLPFYSFFLSNIGFNISSGNGKTIVLVLRSLEISVRV